MKADKEVSEKTDEEQITVQGNEEHVDVQSDCFSIVDQTVMVDMGRLGEFHKFLRSISTTPCDFNKLIKKIITYKPYFGIAWFGTENNIAAGKISPSSPLYKLIK